STAAGREVEVGGVARRRRDETETPSRRLDTRRRVDGRERGGERLVARLELRALVVELRDGHVGAQDGDVHRDDAEEEEREEDHPDDVAADAALRGLAPRAYGRRRTPGRRGPPPPGGRCRLGYLCVGEPVDGRHQASSAPVFTAARRRADAARGFAASSA